MRLPVYWMRSVPPRVVLVLAILTELALLALNVAYAPHFGFWLLHLMPVAAISYYGGEFDGAVAAIIIVLLTTSDFLPQTVEGAGGVDLALRLAFGIGFATIVHRLAELERHASGPSVSRYPPRAVDSRAFFRQVEGEVSRAKRYGRAFTLIYLRIDNLPNHRSCLVSRHATEALNRVLYHLRGSLRTSDSVAQVRPREFALLLPESDVEAARIVLRRIQRLLVVATGEDTDGLIVSIGATTWLRGTIDAVELHQRTYQLMYTAAREHNSVRHQVLDEQVTPIDVDRQLVLSR
jgi:diguanylate cyclase (GGDEF)-like protein